MLLLSSMCCLRWPETVRLLQDVRQEWQHLLPKVLAPFKASPGETPRGVHIQRQVFCVGCPGYMHCVSSCLVQLISSSSTVVYSDSYLVLKRAIM